MINEKEEPPLSCHYTWQVDEAIFTARIDRNTNSCLQHIASNPEPSAYNFLGFIYVKQRQFIDAERCFQQALHCQPNDPVALLNSYYLSLNMGKKTAAAAFLSQYHALSPDEIHGFTHWNKAYFYTRLYLYREAMEQYDFAIGFLPKKAGLLLLYKGILYNRKNEPAQAINSLEQAMKTRMTARIQWLVLIQLGVAHGSLRKKRGENFKKAVTFFKRAQKIQPNDEMVLKHLGKLYVKRKKFTAAIQFFEQSLAEKETSYAHHNLGLVHLAIKDPDLMLALRHFEDAIRLLPENHFARLDCARTLNRLSRSGEAIGHCRRLMSSSLVKDSQLLLCYAEALEKEGESEGAAELYEQLLQLERAKKDHVATAEKWLVRYYETCWRTQHSESSLIRYIDFIQLKQSGHAALKALESSGADAAFPPSFSWLYYCCRLYAATDRYEMLASALMQAFSLAPTATDRFDCYHHLYQPLSDIEEFVTLASPFYSAYVAFEVTFHAGDHPIFHRGLSAFYSSKQPEKGVLLDGELVHSKLHQEAQRFRASKAVSRKSKTTNYLCAMLGFIVSYPGQAREFIQIPLVMPQETGEEDERQKSKPVHVMDVYEFILSGKGYHRRSSFLLNDVLASKPLEQEKNIKSLFSNTKSQVFHRRFHCSERAFFGYINQAQVIGDIIDAIERRCGNPTSLKLSAMIFDFHSERYLCNDCTESVFFWYNPKGLFLKAVTAELLNRGHRVRGKTGTIDSLVRVSALGPAHGQKVASLDDHALDVVDLKALRSPNNAILLQRDDNSVSEDTHAIIFTNMKN